MQRRIRMTCTRSDSGTIGPRRWPPLRHSAKQPMPPRLDMLVPPRPAQPPRRRLRPSMVFRAQRPRRQEPIYLTMQGGASEVEVADLGALHAFPQCPNGNDLQRYLGEWIARSRARARSARTPSHYAVGEDAASRGSARPQTYGFAHCTVWQDSEVLTIGAAPLE